MAPASCSLWPCCKRGVTSCLSLCLFFALPEGPRGTGRGCDGSTADPRGYDPPGPGPSYLPASAASADGHRCGPRSSCRVPGPLSLCRPSPSSRSLHRPHFTPKGAGTVTAASRLAVSQAQAWTHRLTQLAMHRESHTCPYTFALIHSHKCIPTQGHADADIKAQTHHEFRDTWTHRYGSHTNNSQRDTDSHISIYSGQRALIGATVCCH